MAAKAASLARELKLIKSDLCFMQERSALLEEENRRLRDGFVKGLRPEEDDLVRDFNVLSFLPNTYFLIYDLVCILILSHMVWCWPGETSIGGIVG